MPLSKWAELQNITSSERDTCSDPSTNQCWWNTSWSLINLVVGAKLAQHSGLLPTIRNLNSFASNWLAPWCAWFAETLPILINTHIFSDIWSTGISSSTCAATVLHSVACTVNLLTVWSVFYIYIYISPIPIFVDFYPILSTIYQLINHYWPFVGIDP